MITRAARRYFMPGSDVQRAAGANHDDAMADRQPAYRP